MSAQSESASGGRDLSIFLAAVAILVIAAAACVWWRTQGVAVGEPERASSRAVGAAERTRAVAVRNAFKEGPGGGVAAQPEDACSGMVLVHVKEECASEGEWILRWGAGERGGRWEADSPSRLTGLPCAGAATLDLRAEGCVDRVVDVELALPAVSAEVVLWPDQELVLIAVDGETGARVPGARLLREGRLLGETDAWGEVSVSVADADYQGRLALLATGFAPAMVLPRSSGDGGGEIELRLTPVELVEVRCTDDGGPCPDTARVVVYGTRVSATMRDCSRISAEIWECPVTTLGEQVQAWDRRRSSIRIPIAPSDSPHLRLSGHDSEVCLGWDEAVEGPCTLHLQSEASRRPSSTVVDGVASGDPVAVSLPSEGVASGVLLCALDAWRGEVAVHPVGEAGSRCQKVSPIMVGWICGEALGQCYAHPLFGGLRAVGPFTGCSDGLSAGRYRLDCEMAQGLEVEVLSGESVDIDADR